MTITDFSSAGIYLENAGGSITGSEIRHDLAGTVTGTGIHVKGGAPSLEDNTVRGVSNGVLVEGTAASWGTPSLVGNTLRESSGAGLLVKAYGAPFVTGDNFLTLNNKGVHLQGNHVVAANPAPVLTGNRIQGNTGWQVLVQSYGSGIDAVIEMEQNYWGTVDPAAIATAIYDRTDSPAADMPVVDFVPFRDAVGSPVAADHLLVGFVTGATTLSGATPYDVVGYLAVRPGVTMTIDPGVTLRFVPTASLEVQGTLLASGTAGSPLTFTSLKAPPARGDWRGIRVHPESTGSTLEHALVEWAQRGIDVSGASVAVRDSTFREFSQAGLYLQAGASGELTRLLVDNTNRQATGIYLTSTSPHITASTIQNNQVGIVIHAASNPTIDGGNVITGNTYGIQLLGNATAAANPNAVIRRNDLSGNLTAAIQLSQIYNVDGTYSLDATENWWGTVSPGAVASELQVMNVPAGSVAPDVQFSNFLDGPDGAPIAGTYRTYVLSAVTHSAPVLEPAFGGTVDVGFTIAVPVTVSLLVCVENDETCANPVRTITTPFAAAGPQAIPWDGRDDLGEYVPDEAYAYKLIATDGVADGVNEAVYFPARKPVTYTFDKGTLPASFNSFRNEYWKTTVTLSRPLRLSLMVGTTFVWEDRPYPAGQSLVVWDGRDSNGAIRSGQTGIYFFLKTPLRDNSFIVRKTTPSVVGLGVAPQVEVKSDPYLVYHSYEQLSRMAYRIDHDAQVTVKLLPPGISNPSDPSAIVVLPPTLQEAQDAGGPIDHVVEWTGYEMADTNAIRTAEEGAFSFVIQATSVETGLTSTYRGVLQARN